MAADHEPPTVLVVTASTLRQAAAIEKELQSRKDFGAIPAEWLVFTVPDPSSARVGSGGATLNALATVEDLLSTSHVVLEDARIFMIHSGGDSQRLPSNSVCGKAWCAFPALGVQNSLNAPLDLALNQLRRMFRDVKRGLVVACSDVLLLFPPDSEFDWSGAGVTGLAVPAPSRYGPNHGVYWTGEDRSDEPEGSSSIANVRRFFQKPSSAELREAGAIRHDDTVLLDCGIVYFDRASTARLLELKSAKPLDACTYVGPENGAPALRIELYSDIMMALGHGVGLSRDEYLGVASADTSASRVRDARLVLWSALSDTPFRALCVEGSRFCHVGTTIELLELLTSDSPFRKDCKLLARAACYEVESARVADSTDSDALAEARASAWRSDKPCNVVMNSLLRSRGSLGEGAVVEHCELSGSWAIGAGSLCSSVRTLPGIRVRAGMAVQEVHLGDFRVVTLWGVKDEIKKHYTAPGATFCGQPWADVLRAGGVSAEDIWHDVPDSHRTLWTARVFAVFPLSGGAPDLVRAGSSDHLPGSSSRDIDGSGWAPSYARTHATAVADRDAALWMQDARRANFVAVERWRLARRVSLKELLQLADASVEFDWRRQLRNRIEIEVVLRALRLRQDTPLKAALRRLVEAEGGGGSAAYDRDGDIQFTATQNRLLAGLDELAATAQFDVAAHALSIIAECLWGVAGWGGLLGGRSGPARHPDWAPALALLARCGDDEEDEWVHDSGAAVPMVSVSAGRVTQRCIAVSEMAKQRDRWSAHRHLIGRAARHYARASQIMVSKCVATALVEYQRSEKPPLGTWVQATAPARIDIAGGWSDTPPITFEAQHTSDEGGGVVTNVAVLVDGERPIGTRARVMSEPVVVIREREKAPADRVADAREMRSEFRLERLADFDDHDSPRAPAALVKCALLCMGTVALVGRDSAFVSTVDSSTVPEDSPDSLSSQLMARCGGGLEIETWSLLPAGSGLGTSSILAGTVLAAVAGALGREYDRATLTKLALRLEQILTTGGGWQDQVGGLYPGVKVSYCPAALPINVRVLPVTASSGAGAGASDSADASIDMLDRHLVLVYTGRTRLAKNLLQRVLQQWSLRDDDVPQIVTDLCRNAEAAAHAIENVDPAATGACLSTYWEQKKRMAPGSEPPEVSVLLRHLGSHVYGASLAGAGGGGFLALMLKREDGDSRGNKEIVEELLASSDETRAAGFSVHSATVDRVGLQVTVGSD